MKIVGSGTSGRIASRTFSPPRMPFSQSWTTAVFIGRSVRRRRRDGAGDDGSCPPPPGLPASARRRPSASSPRPCPRRSRAARRLPSSANSARTRRVGRQGHDAARDRVDVHRIDEVGVAAGDLLQRRGRGGQDRRRRRPSPRRRAGRIPRRASGRGTRRRRRRGPAGPPPATMPGRTTRESRSSAEISASTRLRFLGMRAGEDEGVGQGALAPRLGEGAHDVADVLVRLLAAEEEQVRARQAVLARDAVPLGARHVGAEAGGDAVVDDVDARRRDAEVVHEVALAVVRDRDDAVGARERPADHDARVEQGARGWAGTAGRAGG